MLENDQGVRPEKYNSWVTKYCSFKNSRLFCLFSISKIIFISFHKVGKLTNCLTQLKTHTRKSHHLSLIANITQSQIKRLEKAGVNTIDEAANLSSQSIPRLSKDITDRIKNQAELQISSENTDKPDFKILPHSNDRLVGLSLLPPHSDNDIFFDIEGFPYVEGGLEYLWGATYFNQGGKRQFKDLGTR